MNRSKLISDDRKSAILRLLHSWEKVILFETVCAVPCHTDYNRRKHNEKKNHKSEPAHHRHPLGDVSTMSCFCVLYVFARKFKRKKRIVMPEAFLYVIA